MNLNLVIVSGLPGTGKTTLSTALARFFQFPLLRIDDLAGDVHPGAGEAYWDGKMKTLLTLAEAQLQLGLSGVLDSVFMAYDRHHAQNLAHRQQALFRPIHTFVSDSVIWRERVETRVRGAEDFAIATRERIQRQQQGYLPWQAGTALLLDSVDPFEKNFGRAVDFVGSPSITLESLDTTVKLVDGRYHRQ
jgi:predicted kinase